jgi:hypothetical protein
MSKKNDILEKYVKLNTKKEGYTIDLLGYSALEFKKHIELLFTEGMS